MSFQRITSGLFRRMRSQSIADTERTTQVQVPEPVRIATKAERELAIHIVRERLRGLGYVPQTTCGSSTIRQMHRTRGD